MFAGLFGTPDPKYGDDQMRETTDGFATVLERLNGLGELIERDADAAEEASQLSDRVIAALEESGVFGIMAPRAVGGLEVHPREILDALSTISYFDGSTGWYCQAAITGPAVAGAFLGERAVEAIFHSAAKATCAGQAAPTGKAERVGDSYRISGSFSFGSGLPNAAWVVGGYILHEDGVPVLNAHGLPTMLIAFAPRAKVELLGNWEVLGLRGTGSYDFRVEEQLVHRDFAFEVGNAEAQRGGALYRMGFNALPALCHSSFGVGCAQRAIDEWTALAQTKRRANGKLVAETETFQKDLALSQARLRAARSYVRATFSDLFDAAGEGMIPDGLKVDGRMSASLVLAVGTEICQTAFASSTTTALRNGSRLQRCFRDMQAGNAHFLTAEQSLIDAGAFLAGLPGAAHGLF
jgi:alkylation response protein AidB-like acyl-CoA dehydrogenase